MATVIPGMMGIDKDGQLVGEATKIVISDFDIYKKGVGSINCLRFLFD